MSKSNLDAFSKVMQLLIPQPCSFILLRDTLVYRIRTNYSTRTSETIENTRTCIFSTRLCFGHYFVYFYITYIYIHTLLFQVILRNGDCRLLTSNAVQYHLVSATNTVQQMGLLPCTLLTRGLK